MPEKEFVRFVRYFIKINVILIRVFLKIYNFRTRMIEDCCYGILEKPNVTSIKMKPTRDIIFEILAILITQYNNAISCKVKIVQVFVIFY